MTLFGTYIFFDSVIGGWGNTQSVVRLCMQCANQDTASTPAILSGTEYREFLISFANDLIEVGIVGSSPFISYQSSTSIDVSYIGITTGYGSEGSWEFCGFGKLKK